MNNGSMIVTYGIRTTLVGGMLGTSFGIMYLGRKWNSLIQLLQSIYQLDLKVTLVVTHIDLAGPNELFYFGGLCWLLFLMLLLSYNVGTVVYIDDRMVSWSMIFAQLYFNVIYFAAIYRCYCLACVLSFRFVHLNNALKLRFDTSNEERDGRWIDGTIYRDGTVQERIRIVQKLSELHHQLNEITIIVNAVYGDIILINMLVVMTFCAFNIFTLFKVYGSSDIRTLMFAVFNFGGSSFYTMMFMLFIHQFRKMSKEVINVIKFTGVWIHKAMNNETNGELIQSMVLFSRQIRNRSAVIRSRHVIFDWPFVFQVG
uniref:Gustatory receptor n=1 Tax=Anopheles minimus TaxID=112268 RepID=A0A182VW93_9DIPT